MPNGDILIRHKADEPPYVPPPPEAGDESGEAEEIEL
jgi:hypothetical protein